MPNEAMSNALMESRIREVLLSIREQVHPSLTEHVQHLLDVGEFRIAGEHLCELLCEDQVVLGPLPHSKLLELVRDLGVDDRHHSTLPAPSTPLPSAVEKT